MNKQDYDNQVVFYQGELIGQMMRLQNKEITEVYTFLAPLQIFNTFEEHFDFDEQRDTDEWDPNGWQYDYWIPFALDGVKYEIAGSGYYGTTIISIKDEEE